MYDFFFFMIDHLDCQRIFMITRKITTKNLSLKLKNTTNYLCLLIFLN